jgi:hypothetical protein
MEWLYKPAERQETYWKMYYEDGLSGFQIAERMGVSPATVYTGIKREERRRTLRVDRAAEQAGELREADAYGYAEDIPPRRTRLASVKTNTEFVAAWGKKEKEDKERKRKYEEEEVTARVARVTSNVEEAAKRLAAEAREIEATREPKVVDKLPSLEELRAKRSRGS